MPLPYADALLDALPTALAAYTVEDGAPRLDYANAAASAHPALHAPEAWPDALRAACADAAASGEPREVALPDGLPATALPLGAGSVALALGTGTSDALRTSLAASEERLRLATESATIGTWDYNPLTGTIVWDARCNAIFGLPPEVAVDYAGFLAMLHPEDRDRTDAIVSAATDPAGSGEYDTAYRVVRASGEVRWVHARGRALFEGEGEARRSVRFLGALRDITEERAAALRVEASQARTRALLDAASDVILVYPLGADGPGAFTDVNDAASDAYGYSSEDLARMTILDLLSASGRAAHEDVMRTLRTERVARYEAIHRTADGRRVPVETTARLLELDGELVVLSISRDVSERRSFLRELARVNNELERRVAERTGALEERERAVQRLSTQLESILVAAGDGIYGLDLDGRTTFMNPTAAALTGYRADECIGVGQHEQIHGRRADGTPYPREACPIYAVMRDGQSRTVTGEVFWRKDGTALPVEYVSTALYEDGAISGAVVVFRRAVSEGA